MFAFNLDEFAHEALQGAAGNGDGFALGEVFEDEFDGLEGEIAHEAEALNLVIGDGHGFPEFSDEGDGAIYKEDVAEFSFGYSHENIASDNRDNDFFGPVAPLAFHGVQG